MIIINYMRFVSQILYLERFIIMYNFYNLQFLNLNLGYFFYDPQPFRIKHFDFWIISKEDNIFSLKFMIFIRVSQIALYYLTLTSLS